MQKKIFIGSVFLFFVIFNGIFLMERRSRRPRGPTAATERRDLSAGMRFGARSDSDDYLALVGALVKKDSWTKVLALSQDQKRVITQLDDLARQTHFNAIMTDAEYVDGGASDFREYARRNHARRCEAISHAQRITTLGLLTDSQAAFVIQQYVSSLRPSYVLSDVNVQALLGMSQEQVKKLVKTGEELGARESRENVFSNDPEVQKRIRVEMASIARAGDQAAMGLLTPLQLAIWSRLSAKQSLPAQPPDLPALSDAEAARINIEGLSPTFRTVAERANALGLTADQKKLLKEFEAVTRQGLWWISHRKLGSPDGSKEQTEGTSRARAEFIKEAEQFTLSGILTEKQANEVRAAIKNI
jgi:hypothetical protein